MADRLQKATAENAKLSKGLQSSRAECEALKEKLARACTIFETKALEMKHELERTKDRLEATEERVLQPSARVTRIPNVFIETQLGYPGVRKSIIHPFSAYDPATKPTKGAMASMVPPSMLSSPAPVA